MTVCGDEETPSFVEKLRSGDDAARHQERLGQPPEARVVGPRRRRSLQLGRRHLRCRRRWNRHGAFLSGPRAPRLDPASVCELKNLRSLDLSGNDLTGTFPAAALKACAQLHFLDVSYNAFSGALLSGDIAGLSPLMELLNLSYNGFNGTVPATVGRLPNLATVRIQNNRFTGCSGQDITQYLTDRDAKQHVLRIHPNVRGRAADVRSEEQQARRRIAG
ncbi:probably inactive leucine-rich repeat receptor-like protein kinase At5g06940 [Setaria italica]|uniref:probably inactive leucine-rich repeat receptor-like protein kinase At5g06940 n=1 Tax=Setaria italica TaxID=4555 RepID=UPI00064555B1|nr:probably inactive leucine-rich repeat receptor-like protein kinase At5g06940 [Setaria italica]